MRRISTRWIPHLLTKEQKLAWAIVETVPYIQQPILCKYHRSLAMRSGFTFMIRSERYIKIWATKGSQRPCIAKRTMSVKKVIYAIFFTNQGHAIQISEPKGKSVNAKFYMGKGLYRL
jgi:hypothetical protein